MDIKMKGQELRLPKKYLTEANDAIQYISRKKENKGKHIFKYKIKNIKI